MTVHLEVLDAVAVLTIHRPDVRNRDRRADHGRALRSPRHP